MRRYAVPLVLIVWAVGLAVDCDAVNEACPLLLAVAVLLQLHGLAESYRSHHRRLR